MKLKALNSIKHGGDYHYPGDVFDADKKTSEYLLNVGAAVEYGGRVAVEYDGEALFESAEDLSALKVDELKAICHYLEIPATGNKGELVAAIEAVSAVEEVEEDEEQDDA